MSSVRKNKAHEAVVDLSRVFAQGNFRLAYEGEYTKGRRTGEACVSKIFKTGSVFEAAYFDTELKIVSRALEIVESFNRDKVIGVHVRLNMPAVWEVEETGEKRLVEPLITQFENFNSNSGWTPCVSTQWTDAMQTLSHYSYHVSKQQVLLCDLEGGIVQGSFVLTDPVITSSNCSKEYGPTDLGSRGISTFFAHHQCNQYCQSDWSVPIDRYAYYPKKKGSSMELNHLPTRWSRDSMTASICSTIEDEEGDESG